MSTREPEAKRHASTLGLALALSAALAPALAARTGGDDMNDDLKQEMTGGKATFVHKASDLSGSAAKNAEGKKIGDIEELVLERDTGQVQYAVLAIGGFLGIGEELYALPWQLLSPRHDEKQKHFFLVDVTKEKLESAPAFPRDQWPTIDSAWEARIHEHYGTEPPAHARPIEAGTNGHDTRELTRCDDLVGAEVHGLGDAKIGEISEVAIDPTEGCVNFVVMETDEALEVDDQYVIPWDVLLVKSEAGETEVHAPRVSKAELELAPVYDPKAWAMMSNPIWVREVYVFWDVEPYWSDDAEAGYTEPAPNDEGAMDKGESMKKEDEMEGGASS